MKLFYKYMGFFFNFSPTSNHLHSLQVENCDSNSRLVVDEDANGKFRLERVICQYKNTAFNLVFDIFASVQLLSFFFQMSCRTAVIGAG